MQSAPATLHTILNAADYSDDPARQFDYYYWDRATPVIVFVHGGAWRSYVLSAEKKYSDVDSRTAKTRQTMLNSRAVLP